MPKTIKDFLEIKYNAFSAIQNNVQRMCRPKEKIMIAILPDQMKTNKHDAHIGTSIWLSRSPV